MSVSDILNAPVWPKNFEAKYGCTATSALALTAAGSTALAAGAATLGPAVVLVAGALAYTHADIHFENAADRVLGSLFGRRPTSPPPQAPLSPEDMHLLAVAETHVRAVTGEQHPVYNDDHLSAPACVRYQFNKPPKVIFNIKAFKEAADSFYAGQAERLVVAVAAHEGQHVRQGKQAPLLMRGFNGIAGVSLVGATLDYATDNLQTAQIQQVKASVAAGKWPDLPPVPDALPLAILAAGAGLFCKRLLNRQREYEAERTALTHTWDVGVMLRSAEGYPPRPLLGESVAPYMTREGAIRNILRHRPE